MIPPFFTAVEMSYIAVWGKSGSDSMCIRYWVRFSRFGFVFWYPALIFCFSCHRWLVSNSMTDFWPGFPVLDSNSIIECWVRFSRFGLDRVFWWLAASIFFLVWPIFVRALFGLSVTCSGRMTLHIVFYPIQHNPLCVFFRRVCAREPCTHDVQVR